MARRDRDRCGGGGGGGLIRHDAEVVAPNEVRRPSTVVLQVSGSSPATVCGRGGGREGDVDPTGSTPPIPLNRRPPPSLSRRRRRGRSLAWLLLTSLSADART